MTGRLWAASGATWGPLSLRRRSLEELMGMCWRLGSPGRGIAAITGAPLMPRPRVLVVTDERETAEAIHATLTAERYDVDTVGLGEDALEQFAQWHYDLLISSIRLPDLDGRDLFFALRERWPFAYPRVIFLVRDGAPIPPRAGGLTGSGAPVLPVPFAPAALRDMARRALGVL